MTRWRSTTTALLLVAGLASLPLPLLAQTPKPGGVLTVMQREELPQGLSILETSTIATVWPASPPLQNENRSNIAPPASRLTCGGPGR